MSFFQPLTLMSSQAARAMMAASAFGQTTRQATARNWRCPLARASGGRSSTSSPASAVAVVATPAPLCELPSAMAAHLLAQQIGDLGGGLGDGRRVDPAGPLHAHRDIGQHPAGTAAQHHDAVTEP